jgi:hypothetical protein
MGEIIMRQRSLYMAAAGALIILLLAAGCKEKETILQSNWGHSEFEGSGSLLNRSRPMTYLEDERMNIGLQNDADNFYMILRTSDKHIRSQVKRGGLTIWFDPAGGNKRAFGIRYPLGIPKSEFKIPKDKYQRPDSTRMQFEAKLDSLVNLDTLEVLDSLKNEERKYLKSDIPDLAISLTDTLGMMIYELRMPLKAKSDSSYAVGANPGQAVGIGFESGKFSQNFPKNDSLENSVPGGGQGGFGGAPMGYGESSAPPRRRYGMMSEPIDFWAKVILASPDIK